MAIRVCHVTSVHPYTDGRILRKECKSLTKKYEVCLIAPNTEDKVLDGVQIYGVQLPTSRLKRMRSLGAVFRKMMEVDADVYHFHDPELIPVGVKAKKLGKKVIFDSHEDVPISISEKEWIPHFLRKPISSIYRHYEERKLRQFDALVSVTPSIVDRLKKCNPNTYQITNFPVVKAFKDDRQWQNYVCFTGGISAQWMHENLIKGIEGLEVKYVLAGIVEDGYMNKLQELPGWSNVDFRGLVTPAEVADIQKGSFAGIALNDYVANVGFKLGSLGNTKLFEYMMAGIPVICTDFILWKEIIDNYQCGICVNPRDVNAVRQAVVYLRQHLMEAKQMGNNGRRAVEELYNWDSQERVLFEMYQALLK